MILVMLLAVIGTQGEQDVIPNDTTMNTVRPPIVSMTIFLAASPSSTSPHGKSGKGKELRLQ